MKSTQLLSVVLSLIMVFGVTAGSAYAQTDDVGDTSIEDEIEDLEMEIEKKVEEIESEMEEGIESVESEMEEGIDDATDEESDGDVDYARDGRHYNLDERLAHFCDMPDEETREFFEHHPRLAQFSDRLANFCDLTDYARDSKLKDFIRLNITDEDREPIREYIKDHIKREYHDDDDVDKDFRGKLDSWCEMSEDEKSAAAEEHGKTDEMVARANSYCTMDESDRTNFIEEHRAEFREHMKERMMEKKSHHMNYERLCTLTDSERAAEIDDSEKLERLANWCEMTPEEREEYKKEHYGEMKEKMHDKVMDKKYDKKHEMKIKLSDKSDRIKAMIMSNHDISDEKRAELKAKYMEKYGDLADEKKSELKMKFAKHLKAMKHNFSDERKSDIQDRIAEMKAFKAELREKASEMTDEEKQELRAEFIEKAKDMQLAWISPRTQIVAGVDAAEVECREGFNLVMKASNGVPMCLKADTALKMIDRGIVVPAS